MADLEAGPALDALVARVVFGRDVIQSPRSGIWGYPDGIAPDTISTKSIPSYSTSIAAAFLVIERMVALGHTKWMVDHDQDGYAAMFSRLRTGMVCEHSPVESCCCCWEWVQESGDTAPLAICRAALAAAS